MFGAMNPIVELARDLSEKARDYTLELLSPLDPSDLLFRPKPDANPIGWLLWHIGEVEESILWAARGETPSFHFGLSCLRARGDGKLPDRERLIAYLLGVRSRYRAFLDGIEEDDLDRAVTIEGFPPTPLRELIFISAQHEIYHAGQIAYLRRLLGKPMADMNARNPYQ